MDDRTNKEDDNPSCIDKRTWSQIPFSARWRAHVIRLPRHMPRPLLHITSPGGPYPSIVYLPSRYSNHKIPVWVFLPPGQQNRHSHGQRHGVAALTSFPGVHLDFHGGGFVMGSPFERAPFCARIARERGCVVIGVDYAIGPLYEFPAALGDAEDVLKAVLDVERRTESGKILYQAIAHRHHQQNRTTEELTVDPRRLSFSGNSSGGNVVLNLLLNIQDSPDQKSYPCLVPESVHEIPVILFYPQYEQIYDSYNRPTPSEHEENVVARPAKFGRSIEERLAPFYLPNHLRSHPRASPTNVDPQNLHPKCRLFIVIPEKDTLNGPARDWADQVRKAGFAEYLKVYNAPNQGHGFFHFPDRSLGTRSFRIKKDIHENVMKFWDDIEVYGRPGQKEVTGHVSENGYAGTGVGG